MTENKNWFKISRDMLLSPIWLDEKFTRGQAWVDLIGLANFKDGFIRVRGNRIDIKRGQVGWSLEKLCRRWKWSRGKINRWLDELEMDGRIVQQKNRVSSVITIANYNAYQLNSKTESTTDGGQTDKQTEDRRTDRRLTNKKDKKVKNDKNLIIILDYWNSQTLEGWQLESKPPNESISSRTQNVLKKCRGATSRIESEYRKVVTEFKEDDIRHAIDQYVHEIAHRKKTEGNDYYKHRFSFHDFLKQQNGLRKFVELDEKLNHK